MAGRVRKAADERFYLSGAKGGGMVRREIWTDERGMVARYTAGTISTFAG